MEPVAEKSTPIRLFLIFFPAEKSMPSPHTAINTEEADLQFKRDLNVEDMLEGGNVNEELFI